MANPLFQPVLAARCLLLNEINDIRGRLTAGKERSAGRPAYTRSNDAYLHSISRVRFTLVYIPRIANGNVYL